MSRICPRERTEGGEACASEASDAPACGVFQQARIERAEDIPAPDPRLVDVAVLDMNHGWPNLGHDSLLHVVSDIAWELMPVHERTGLAIRALSYDVRRSGIVPEAPGGARQLAVYVGSGGPGHLDPRRNDGRHPGSQGIHEDPSWEAPLFRLFDAVRDHGQAALLGVCHAYGVMCRWAGVAEPLLRGEEKGGKASGILENVFTPEAQAHPWFGRFAERLPEERRLRVVENRLYDLVPPTTGLPPGALPIGLETLGVGGPPGDALTMVELARDGEGVMSRLFGVNHHPEIVDRARQLRLLQQKLDRGEVSRDWVAERREILTRAYPDDDSDQQLRLTSEATLIGPLRFHIQRQVRLRAESLGLDSGLHEEQALEQVAQGLPRDAVAPRA